MPNSAHNGANGHVLFDRDKDPLEMTNLADNPDYKSVVDELTPLTRALFGDFEGVRVRRSAKN